MKKKNLYLSVLFIIVFALSGCKKEEDLLQVTEVTTFSVSDISYQSATCGGSVSCEGTTITACGICWSTKESPTIYDSITVDRNKAGSFTSTMKSLQPNLIYYVRAYATDGTNTIYGSTMTFKTKRASIGVTTTQANTILHNSAICGGTIFNANNAALVTRGVCWSLSPYPTIEDDYTTYASTGNNFSVKLSNLEPNKLYYARAYAGSNNELIYGGNIVFKTRQTALSITGPTLSNITTSTVKCSGTVTSEQPTAIIERGVCWSTNSIPTVADNKSIEGKGDGTFTASVTDLKANTTYNIRTYVTDIEGTVYGDIVSFKTNDNTIVNVPTVSTLSVVKTSTYNAKLQGQITSEGNASVTSYGYYCSTSANPVESNSFISGYDYGTTTSFSMTIVSLTSGVKYYARAFAKNSYGIGYGNVIEYVH